jgi:putative addiction module killer protein
MNHDRSAGVHGPRGRSPFQEWFEDLGARAAAKVTVALTRLEQANVSNVKGVAGGVLELRIGYGPGYRVYIGKDRGHLGSLPGGWTKRR